MLELFKMGGPMMVPIALIAIAIVALAVRAASQLSGGRMPPGGHGEARLQALPFWGVMALLLGLLGQSLGHFKSLSAMIAAETISPRAVLLGLRECFVTTLAGLAVCIVALLAWVALRGWHRVRSAEVV